MEIKTVDIVAYRAVASDKSQLLQDCEVVADTKPAIDKVLKADANIIITSKDVIEDRVNFKGKLFADILYLAKGDKSIHSISNEANINDFVEVKGAKEGMNGNIDIVVSNIDYSLINDRKVNVSTMADVSAKVSEKVELEAVSEIEDFSKEQQKFYNITTNAIINENKDRFSVNEQVILPLSKPPIDEVLSIDCNIANPEIIAGDDSVKVKGDVLVTLLYTDSEGGLPEIYEFDLPFDGSFESDNTTPYMNTNGTFYIDSVHYDIEPNSDDENRVINMDIGVVCEYIVSDNEENQILEDAYSINNEVNMDIERICCDYVVCKNRSQYPVKEVITLEDTAPDMLQIFKTGGKPYIDDVKIEDNRVIIEGIINTDIMYVTGNDEEPIYNYKGVIPFNQVIDARGAKDGMTADVKANIAHIGFNMLSDREVEVRCALNTTTVVTQQICYDIPTSAELTPIDDSTLANMPGIVLYVVKKGDTLWKLAKRFNSTIDDIVAINNIENPDLIYPGQRFIILKKIV